MSELVFMYFLLGCRWINCVCIWCNIVFVFGIEFKFEVFVEGLWIVGGSCVVDGGFSLFC